MPHSSARRVLLDTTVQIDRNKSKARRLCVEELLRQFDWKATTSICLLEFKATLIQECITIHNKLRELGLYTRVADYLTESSHPQAKLRGHILRNHVNVFAPSSFDVTEQHDRRLAEKARLALERVIPRLYKWFTEQSVDSVLHNGIDCTRAAEPPQKRGVAFGVNLPTCKRGVNKFCRVEEFIRAKAGPLLEGIEAFLDTAPASQLHQLRRTCELFRTVLKDPDIELSHSECRKAGDCLIALEGSEWATHALSTNAADWAQICSVLGCEFIHVRYRDGAP